MSDDQHTNAPKPEEPKPEIFEESADDAKKKRRERLLANLEKGRKTALANRKKKAMYKKLKKKDEVDEMDLSPCLF